MCRMTAAQEPEREVRPPLRVRIAQAMAAHPRLGGLYSDHSSSYLTPHKGATAEYVTEADAVLAVVEAEIDRVARERDGEITQLAAEVERLRKQIEQQHEINAGWAAYGERAKAQRRRYSGQLAEAIGYDQQRWVPIEGMIPLVKQRTKSLTAEIERLGKAVTSWQELWESKEEWEQAATESWTRQDALSCLLRGMARRAVQERQNKQQALDAFASLSSRFTSGARQGVVDDLVDFWHTKDHGEFLDDAARALIAKWWPAASESESVTTKLCTCDGGWTVDENYQPEDYERNEPLRPEKGLIPCGFCNHGGWDAPWPPAESSNQQPNQHDEGCSSNSKRPAPRPRVWRKGDPEPDMDVTAVRHSNSQVFTRRPWPVAYGKRNATTVWQAGPAGEPCSWEYITDRLGDYELTDVSPPPSAAESNRDGDASDAVTALKKVTP